MNPETYGTLFCDKRTDRSSSIPPTCEYTPLPSDGGPSMPINNGSEVQRARDSAGGLVFSSSATENTQTRSSTSSPTRNQSGDSTDYNQQYSNQRSSYQHSYSDNYYSPYDSNANKPSQHIGQNKYHYESTNTYANQPHLTANTKAYANTLYPTSTTFKPTATDVSSVYSSTELLGKPPTAYNIFRGGLSVAAARHARETTHIPTSTAITFNPQNNGPKAINASRIIVDVAAERLIIFTKDEGMDEKTQKLLSGRRDCSFQQNLFDPLWAGFLFVIIVFGISALILQRIYYQRQFNQSTSNSSSTVFGSPFELSGFCRMASSDTAHNSPSLTRLQHRC